jgi:hypothetical protein
VRVLLLPVVLTPLCTTTWNVVYTICYYHHTDVPVVANASSQRNVTCTPPPIPDNTETTNTRSSNTIANDSYYSFETSSNQGANKDRQSSGRKVVNAGEWLKDGKVCIAIYILDIHHYMIYNIHCFNVVT